MGQAKGYPSAYDPGDLVLSHLVAAVFSINDVSKSGLAGPVRLSLTVLKCGLHYHVEASNIFVEYDSQLQNTFIIEIQV